jgi:hypothetical protein
VTKYLKIYLRNRERAIAINGDIKKYESPYISEETKLAAVKQNGWAT